MRKAFLILSLFATSLIAAPSAKEQTLAIIKPDALSHETEILAYYEKSDLKLVATKKLQLTNEQAEAFYAVHKERPFYKGLVSYMTSGPVEVLVLEGEDAVALNRQLIGATDPKKASPGTIRADFGKDVQHNAIHGSDSADNAAQEIAFFFESK
jgi:nucleoside-diphosphate kinase